MLGIKLPGMTEGGVPGRADAGLIRFANGFRSDALPA